MKLTSLLTGIALLGLVTVWDAPLKAMNPQMVQASAQEVVKIAAGKNAQQKIAQLTAIKGETGQW